MRNDRQNAMLLAAATAGGVLTINEIATRCEWSVQGMPRQGDDRFNVEAMIAAGFLVRDREKDPAAGRTFGASRSFRLTTIGYRAAWNATNC